MSIYLHLSLPVTPSRLGFVSKGNLNRLDNILCFTIGINSQYPVSKSRPHVKCNEMHSQSWVLWNDVVESPESQGLKNFSCYQYGNRGKRCIKRTPPYQLVYLWDLKTNSALRLSNISPQWCFSVKTINIVYFLSSFIFVAYSPGKLIILRFRSFCSSLGERRKRY